jgi:hypothetical protein
MGGVESQVSGHLNPLTSAKLTNRLDYATCTVAPRNPGILMVPGSALIRPYLKTSATYLVSVSVITCLCLLIQEDSHIFRRIWFLHGEQ